jgi:energy-coupling factor transporter ATP-binding protein EcfA2
LNAARSNLAYVLSRPLIFAFGRGEVHAFMGENGAGKSTLMKIWQERTGPDSGEIILDGKTVQFRTPHEARLAGIGIRLLRRRSLDRGCRSGNRFRRSGAFGSAFSPRLQLASQYCVQYAKVKFRTFAASRLNRAS